MEASGMSPRRVAKHQRVDWSAANKGFARKNQPCASLAPTVRLRTILKLRLGVVVFHSATWGKQMRHLLILAASASLAATAAHAQIDPVTGRPYGVTTPGAPSAPRRQEFQPIAPIPPIPPIPGARASEAPFRPFNPATAVKPPKLPQSPYADGQFSPAGEAKRERKENALPQGGPFSPEGEAKRAAAQAKHDKAVASPF
jgi:hypothetical protein